MKKANLKVKQSAAAVQSVIGEDLRQAKVLQAKEMIANAAPAAKIPAKAGSVVVKVSNGINWETKGAELAEATLSLKAEVQDELNALKTLANVSRGELWLSFAMECSTEDEVTALTKAFKVALEAKGHKRAAADASDFKTLCLAYFKSPAEVLGAMAASPEYQECMKCLRDIKNDGQTKARGNSRGTNKKPLGERQWQRVREYVARMNVQQITQLYRMGQSRAAALRKSGEVFEAFPVTK